MSDFDRNDPEALRSRIIRLEQRQALITKAAFPAGAFFVAWVAYEAFVWAWKWSEHDAYTVGTVIFAGVWFWLYFKLEKIK